MSIREINGKRDSGISLWNILCVTAALGVVGLVASDNSDSCWKNGADFSSNVLSCSVKGVTTLINGAKTLLDNFSTSETDVADVLAGTDGTDTQTDTQDTTDTVPTGKTQALDAQPPEVDAIVNINSNCIIPTSGKVSEVWDVTRHTGIDINGPVGTPVYAPCDGTVQDEPFMERGGGNMLKFSIKNSLCSFVFAHLSKDFVEKGQTIKQGQLIALMGDSGQQPYPHLHIESVCVGLQNPVIYIPGFTGVGIGGMVAPPAWVTQQK